MVNHIHGLGQKQLMFSSLAWFLPELDWFAG